MVRTALVAVVLSLVVTTVTPAAETDPPTWKAEGTQGAVVAGGRAAAEAGLEILKGGGNAADAAVATLLALTVTDSKLFCFGGEVPIIVYNGKLERWHGSIKWECIRPAAIDSLDDALRRVAQYVEHYNHTRLHSAIGYVSPADRLNGLDQVIFAERDRKLEEARERRRHARQAERLVA